VSSSASAMSRGSSCADRGSAFARSATLASRVCAGRRLAKRGCRPGCARAGARKRNSQSREHSGEGAHSSKRSRECRAPQSSALAWSVRKRRTFDGVAQPLRGSRDVSGFAGSASADGRCHRAAAPSRVTRRHCRSIGLPIWRSRCSRYSFNGGRPTALRRESTLSGSSIGCRRGTPSGPAVT
jgi:hypothetical protein